MWTTQAQINKEVHDEIQEIKTAIQWVEDRLIDLQKQVILKCDWNSTQFCITPVRLNYTACYWEQIKFHLRKHYHVCLANEILFVPNNRQYS